MNYDERIARAEEKARSVKWVWGKAAKSAASRIVTQVAARKVACAVCGREFTAAGAKGRYCSNACRVKAYQIRKKQQKEYAMGECVRYALRVTRGAGCAIEFIGGSVADLAARYLEDDGGRWEFVTEQDGGGCAYIIHNYRGTHKIPVIAKNETEALEYYINHSGDLDVERLTIRADGGLVKIDDTPIAEYLYNIGGDGAPSSISYADWSRGCTEADDSAFLRERGWIK